MAWIKVSLEEEKMKKKRDDVFRKMLGQDKKEETKDETLETKESKSSKSEGSSEEWFKVRVKHSPGDVKFNTKTGFIEVFNGSEWIEIRCI